MALVKSIGARVAASACLLVLFCSILHAEEKTWRINIPRRSRPTPVQSLNRDGVKAVEKRDYERAKRLFYKAYLLDPNDPFTLNNLGYMAELDGDVDRAQRFYELSQEANSQATVDASSKEELKGKTVAAVAGHAHAGDVQVNVLNVEAISLVNKDRVAEADATLQKALNLDPKNPFTLNNMGYVKEKEGELESAINYYRAAAARNSDEPIVVTVNKSWRGRPISEIADNNAKNVRRSLEKEDSVDTRVARLNQRGVSALNANDRRKAREYFEEAYKLDPNDAFALNNMGYVAELNGDRESADYYYAKAKEADNHERDVTLASRPEDEGKKLQEVASSNDNKAEESLRVEQDLLRRSGKAPVLIERQTGRPVVATPEDPQDNKQNNPLQPQALQPELKPRSAESPRQ